MTILNTHGILRMALWALVGGFRYVAEMSKRRFTMKLMYTPHPEREPLGLTPPQSLVEAVQNDFVIPFNDLLSMRRMIDQLTNDILEFEPQLIPFFAAGGIPYAMPMMHVCERLKRNDLIDGHHFHMFPGLSWDGKYECEDSGTFFARTFAELIDSVDEPVRIWTVDATFTGNAIRRLITCMSEAFSRITVPRENAVVQVAAVIDASRAKKECKDGLLRLDTPYGDRFLVCPAEFEPEEELADGKPVRFKRRDGLDSFELWITFRTAPSIPTEDRAELIGAHAKTSTLGIQSKTICGRLTMEYDNGYKSSSTGGGSVSSSIIHWLSKNEDELPWSKFIETSQLPPLVDNQRDDYDEMKRQTNGGLSIFEAMQNSVEEIVASYIEFNRLLRSVEVYILRDAAYKELSALGGQEPISIPNNLLRKVISSALADLRAADDALELIRVCNLNDATNDPENESNEARLRWWKDRIPRDNQTGSS